MSEPMKFNVQLIALDRFQHCRKEVPQILAGAGITQAICHEHCVNGNNHEFEGSHPSGCPTPQVAANCPIKPVPSKYARKSARLALPATRGETILEPADAATSNAANTRSE